MIGYAIEVGCPRCGSDVVPVTSGRVIADTETSAIVRCTSCPTHLAEFQIMVRLLPMATRVEPEVKKHPTARASCGTDSGYFAHIRQHNEQPCQACRDAHSTAERERAARRAKGRVRELVGAS